MQMAPLRTKRIAPTRRLAMSLRLALFPLGLGARERILTLMSKSLETITEAIRNSKHPFPHVADRPDKPHKNRYERRKVKQYIHLVDWAPEAAR